MVIVSAAWLNWWILVSIGFGIVGVMFRRTRRSGEADPRNALPDTPPTVLSIVLACLGLGAFVAVLVVVVQLFRIRPRTISKLGARTLAPGENPRIDNLLEELAIATGASPVSAAVLIDDAPNAMAVGWVRSRTTIVVTSSLIERLARDELEAVLAVEMCAIRRLDTAMHTTMLACTQGPIAVNHQLMHGEKSLIRWPLAALSAPARFGAEQIRKLGLRTNDFAADDMAVAITRNPDGLRRALRKLKTNRRVVKSDLPATMASLWFEPIPLERDTKSTGGDPWTASLMERVDRLPVR